MEVTESCYEVEVTSGSQQILSYQPPTAGFYGAAVYYRTVELGAEVGLYGAFLSYEPTTLSGLYPATYEMGEVFMVATSGSVSRMAYFKTAGDTLAKVGHVWDENGNLLASATFANETASGWQTQAFDAGPLALAAGTTCVVTINISQTTVGVWGDNFSYFTSPVTNGPISFPANAGRYNLAPGTFPTTVSPNRVALDLDFTYAQLPQVQIALTWKDATGDQSIGLLSSEPKPQGSYVVSPVRIAAADTGPIVLSATTSVPHALFVSAILEKVT